jgi:hypothetical protein
MNVSWPILLATDGFSQFFICHIAKTFVAIQTLYMEKNLLLIMHKGEGRSIMGDTLFELDE